MEWVWQCGGCVIHEIRLAVVWAVLYCGLECVCITAMWMLCVNCGMGCRWAVDTWLRIGVPEA